MIRYILRKNNNKKSPVFNKWFAYPVVEETMDLAALAKHMEQHNSGFSEAMCVGVMKAMVRCIKEMVLEGKNVKLDDLAIFSCGIKNAHGADSEDKFTTTENIKGVKLRARATGDLRTSSLNLDATLRKATALTGVTKTTGTTTSGGTTSGSGTTTGK
ncbi:DNA-binding protein [Prevotella sp. AGR2160]|uniref:HU family DNA-binding protein n=1 Tax=Prevotella sp. AGR2160 TaxID=1280674 RepID=UPI000408B133|nr:DNA-binding protein [Prevotella sp. AGR2160]